jgi:hypothetical protein
MISFSAMGDPYKRGTSRTERAGERPQASAGSLSRHPANTARVVAATRPVGFLPFLPQSLKGSSMIPSCTHLDCGVGDKGC